MLLDFFNSVDFNVFLTEILNLLPIFLPFIIFPILFSFMRFIVHCLFSELIIGNDEDISTEENLEISITNDKNFKRTTEDSPEPITFL